MSILTALWNASQDSDKLAFAGAVIGATATLATGLFALGAAAVSLRPILRQVDLLRQQLNLDLQEKTRDRMRSLESDGMLIERALASVQVVRQHLDFFVQGSYEDQQNLNDLQAAADHLQATIAESRVARMSMWGDRSIQDTRRKFYDGLYVIGSFVIQFMRAADERKLGIFEILRSTRAPMFVAKQKDLLVLAQKMNHAIQEELDIQSKMLAEAEKLSLQKGNYRH